ncbi:MAG TPA: DUF222 domain-containing protein, partial [Micromonosporaceae bacterium]|nr:DUF222 domain-containing protein [Micromonosporaceae bacterium]
ADCVQVLRAQYRQVSHERARLMTAIAEVALRDDADGTGRLAEPSEFAFDEVRAALVWTRRAADAQCALALDLVRRLPAVHAALSQGAIDEPKARIFSDWTEGLADEQARALCAGLLPGAPGWTTGQLVERIKRWAIAIDPHWAQRRYEQAIRGRRVVGSRNSDGSANLCGFDLPVGQVATAYARIDGLAQAAKRGGRRDPIDHIRAELFLGMTDGSYTGMDDAAILTTLLTAAEPSVPSPGSRPGARGVEVRVRLSTLLGLDRHPGELAGWGPVHAELARSLVAQHTAGQWRFVLTDSGGHLSGVGILRRRPTGLPRDGRAGVVEIQVPERMLRALATQAHRSGDWAPVVAELLTHLDNAGDPAAQADPTRRLPGAALRRLVQARDRTCVFPTCRAPARNTDTDHSIEHGAGGPTIAANLGCTCRHDHRLRHDGDWQLRQPRPGHFVWISRLGQTYHVHPAPIIEPLPHPRPREPDD